MTRTRTSKIPGTVKKSKKRRSSMVYEGAVLRAPDLTESQREFLMTYGFKLPTKVRVVRRTSRSQLELWSWTKSRGQELMEADPAVLEKAVKEWQNGSPRDVIVEGNPEKRNKSEGVS